MVNPQTARALRAVGTIDRWTRKLCEIMHEQGVEAFPKERLDDHLAITISRGDLRQLITALREQMAELREFAR
jgi:hypothetical protein